MSLRRSLSWSVTMHELRGARLSRPVVRPSVARPLPPVLINVDGSFNRAGIMRRAHAIARRHQISQPDAAWRSLIAEGLRHAWYEARTAQRARAARLAA